MNNSRKDIIGEERDITEVTSAEQQSIHTPGTLKTRLGALQTIKGPLNPIL